MRFNPKARLDSSRVHDAGRGGGRGGGGLGGALGSGRGLPLPGGLGGGVGGFVVLALVVVVYLLQNSGGGAGGSGAAYDTGRFTDTGRYAGCTTGEDANASADCARVAVENSLDDFWSTTLGDRFAPIEGLTTFEGSISTGCGGASSDVGPFYCPSDRSIYLDDGFFVDVLQGELDGPAGAFVEPYVLAHEYGHHISNLLGTMGQVTGDTGPQSSGVRLELQADCFAGLWAAHATTTEDAEGQVLLLDLTDEDIALAIEAAKAVGDDYIQRRTGGRVDEEVWTHGSSAQRRDWFERGFAGDSIRDCDTFGAGRV
ncbi:neutral zinc metallopeptidase [Nocardioides sp.]|uniref:neutral zinc metallopeptidase n=1 Tax=Nocardioides sp. TaxID=35761 RepID=UPI003518516E